jgi:hypothetical protein
MSNVIEFPIKGDYKQVFDFEGGSITIESSDGDALTAHHAIALIEHTKHIIIAWLTHHQGDAP